MKQRDIENLPLLVPCPDGLNSQGSCRERHRVSHTVADAQALGSSLALFPSTLARRRIINGALGTDTGAHLECCHPCLGLTTAVKVLFGMSVSHIRVAGFRSWLGSSLQVPANAHVLWEAAMMAQGVGSCCSHGGRGLSFQLLASAGSDLSVAGIRQRNQLMENPFIFSVPVSLSFK